MTRQRNLLIVLIAILMGAFAVYLSNAYFSGVETRNAQIAKELNFIPVVAARVPLQYGDQVTADKLKVVQWPASSVPAGYFSDIRRIIADPSGGRVALRPIAAGEPVLTPMLTGAGGRAVISATLPKGKRAVAVRVNDVASVGGFVLPGDSVDVLLTRQPGNGPAMQADQITDTIVENVRVIAADQNANDASRDPQVSKTVTLEVDPVQAQKLALGGQIGTLSLSLRNAANQEPADTPRVTVRDLGARGYPTFSEAPVIAPMSAAYRPVRVRRRTPAPFAARSSGQSVIVGKGLNLTQVEVMP